MRTLSRKKAHRTSLIRNLVTSLVLYESMETTLAKAKEVKTFIDTMIPRAKKGDLNATRYLNSVLFDKNAVKKVVDELVPRYTDRSSGFVRIYKTGFRLGDMAPKARIELIDKKVFIEKTDKTTLAKKEIATKKPAKDTTK